MEDFPDADTLPFPCGQEAVFSTASELGEEAEVSYRTLFESNPYPLWVYECETLRFLLVNKAAVTHYGYAQEEFLALTLPDLRPAEKVPLAMSVAVPNGDGRGKRSFGRHRKQNGQIIEVEITTHDCRFHGRAARWALINDITERRRIEQALQQSEQEQRQLADHLERERERLAEAQAIAKVGSWDLNLTTHALFWSEETYRIFGMDPLEVGASYEAFLERIHPDDRDAVYQAFTGSIANHTPYTIDHRIQRKDGEIRIVQERCQTFYDSIGHPIRSIGTIQDITEQKQTEQQLTRSLNLLQAVTEGTTDAIYAKDLQGRYLMVNTPGAHLVGKTPEEIIGRDDSYLFSPETGVRHRESDRMVLESGETHTEEAVSVAAGVMRTYQSTKGPLRDHIGKVIGIVGISRDVTNLKLAEQATLAMIRGAQCLLWYAFVEMQAHGLQWYIETDEEAAQQFFPVEQPAGMSYTAAWARNRLPEDNPLMDARAEEAMLSGQTGYTQQFRCRRADGEWRWLNETVRIEALSPGRWHCVGVCTDVTDQKRTEEELEARVVERTTLIMETNARLVAAKQEADQANTAKSEFLSRMSHELRTPLNAILGFGQILDRQSLTALQAESVQHILKGGRHLLDLINEILDIARVESGHIELSLEAIALTEIIAESCALVRPLATERHIVIEMADLSPEHSHVFADRQRLKQVLINLLSNGIKYNHPGGKVRVACLPRPDDRLCIAVQDTGPGMTPEEQQRLFTPFERLNAAQSDVEGTGLGLVLAQRLVTAMGGHITLESLPGEGSTFFVDLPQAHSPVERLKEHSVGVGEQEPDQSGDRDTSVLYIEDNPSNLRLMEVLLRSRPGITLQAAIQGSVGLDLAHQHRPDLILLDINLPDISGREVLARLQSAETTRTIPVVVLSADATASQRERLRNAGAAAYLTKPLDVIEFLQTLDTLLPSKPVHPGLDEERKRS